LPPPVHGAANIGLNIKQSNLVNSSFNCDYINLTTQANLKDLEKLNIKKVFVILKLYFQVFKTLLRKRYDLCYLTINSSGPGFYKEVIIVFILKVFRKKIVYHYHNKGITINSKSFVNNLLYKIQFKNSRAILLSSILFYDVSKYLQPSQVYYCNNGIAPLEDNFEKNNNQNKPVGLLFISNIFISKGVNVLLEACKILVQKKFAFNCNFIGGWTAEITEEDFIKKCVEYGISENVKAHGIKVEKEKINFLTDADIFILPTLNDVFPLVILEAMQSSLPVIASDEGAIPEIIVNNSTGFIVPKNDPVELAYKLMILINDTGLRQQMGTKGRERFKELYTLSKFEQNFTNTLQHIIRDFKN